MRALLPILLILVATPACADPVTGALAGFLTPLIGAQAAAAIAGWLVRTIASAALSRLAQGLRKKPTPPGIRTEATQTGGVSPYRFIVGLYATAGQFIAPPNSYGIAGHTPRGWLVYPIALSVVPGCALNRVIVNDAYVELTGASGTWGRTVAGRLANYLHVDFVDGSQTAAHAGMMEGFASDPDRPWSADMVGPGLCAAYVRATYNTRLWQGLPSLLFEVRGIPLYDPRLDSTAGGAGPQRWSNRATWAWSANPVVMIYNIMRGISIGAGLVWGGGYDAEDLPAASWFAAMNACDLPIDDGDGGTNPQYRAGFEVALDDEPLAVIEELLKTCSGQMAEVGGVWDIQVGGPRLPVYTLTDDDILMTQEQQFDPFPSLLETFNGITASYPEPESLWEAKDAPARYNPAWEAEDGGRQLVANLSLPACPWGEQVQRIMESDIADHRRFRSHRFVLPPEAAVLSPLDTFTWTSARWGYTAKSFEIGAVYDSLTTMRQGLAVREVDGSDFAWTPADLLPSTQPPSDTTPTPAQAVPGFAATPATVVDAASAARRPAIDLSWTPQEASDARGLQWQVRLAGSGTVSLSGAHAAFEDGQLRLVAGLLANTAYQVRGGLLVDRDVAWTSWINVTTPDVRLGASDLQTGLATSLATLDGWIGAGINLPTDLGGQAATLREYIDQLRTLTGEVLEGSAQRLVAEQQVRDYLGQAEIRLGVRIDATDDQVSIIAAAVTAVQAVIPGLATATALNALVATVASQGGQITSIADSLTALSVSVGNFSASGLLRVTVEATPGGALSRIGLKAAATGGEASSLRAAALFLEAIAGDKSRVIIQADQFAVANGASNVFPFIISGGQVYLQNLIVTGAVILQGAVSRLGVFERVSSITISGAGVGAGQQIGATINTDFAALAGTLLAVDNPVVITISGIAQAAGAGGAAYFEVQYNHPVAGWSTCGKVALPITTSEAAFTHRALMSTDWAGLPVSGPVQMRLLAYRPNSGAPNFDLRDVLCTMQQVSK